MRQLLTLVLLTVIIAVKEPAHVVGCPLPVPALLKMSDGTYEQTVYDSMNAVACLQNELAWKEEWTDFPEKGGTFIRRVPIHIPITTTD